MLAALACGAGTGAGVWLLARGAAPPRPSLAEALTRLRQPPTPTRVITVEDMGLAGRVGRPLAAGLTRLGGDRLIPAPVSRDLALLDRTPQTHLAEKTTLALLGLLLPAAVATLLAAGGAALPIAVPLWAALLLAAAGFAVPDLGVHVDARARRRDFRHALSAFLDLVTIGLAGGGGVETALHDAARVGTGWALTRLRATLDDARLARETPWVALGRLGAELGIDELVELSASVALAGTEGAKVRASLAAKAVSLRAHQLADSESAAQAATERMSLPVVCLFAAFLVFIGYPAIVRVLTGL